ncbi:MAG: DUF2461 domain-containing protein [Planctomycetota bacterium]
MKLTRPAFALLDELAENNRRDWYQAHKDRLEQHLLGPFGDVLAEAADRLARRRPPLRGGPHTMFRLHRDVRFAKDKRPYKENVSGVLTPDGTKKCAGPILYLQCEPAGGFLAYGVYRPPTDTLGRVRRRVVAKADEFRKLRRALEQKGRGFADMGDTLKRMPRGFETHAEHPHADLLRHKSLIVRHDLSRKDWLTGGVIDAAVALADDTQPLGRFLDAAMSDPDG